MHINNTFLSSLVSLQYFLSNLLSLNYDFSFLSFQHRSKGGNIEDQLSLSVQLNNNLFSFRSRFVPLVDSATEDHCFKVVVGTKMDMLEPGKRKVTVDEARRYSREINQNLNFSKLNHDPYFETSSLEGINIDDVFEYIFQYCLPLSDVEKIKMRNRNLGTINLTESTHDNLKTMIFCCRINKGDKSGSERKKVII
jgi:hypothetical protein